MHTVRVRVCVCSVQAQLVKVGASAERRKWRSEVKALKRELRQREEVISVCTYASRFILIFPSSRVIRASAL